jgi:hypothetical protein
VAIILTSSCMQGRGEVQRFERAPVFWPPEFVQGTHRPTHTVQSVLILLSFIANVARKQPPPLSPCGRLPSPPGYLGGSVPFEGPERRPEGGEWESIKILLENLAYIPKSTRNPSLLTRSRPPSYRQAINLRNRARNCNESTERC